MFPPQARPHTRVIAVTADLIEIAGDGNAALFLAQVLFWWKVKGRRKFYKFNAPCEHTLYRTGDSWLEELYLSRTKFATARRRVATKVRISCTDEIQAAFTEGVLVVYGTDETHLTWYIVNEQALQQRSSAVFERFFDSAAVVSPTPIKTVPKSQPHIRPTLVCTPQSNNSTLPSTVSDHNPSLADAASQHSPMQEPYIGIYTETTSEISLSSRSLDLILPPTSEERQTKSAAEQKTAEIFKGLQKCSVHTNSARLIAHRAVRAGLSTTATLEIFDAHVLDAQRANAVSPVGVAVSRMVNNSHMTSAPTWALERVQRRNQEREWQTQQEIRGGGEQPVDEAVAAVTNIEISPTKSLWRQVLGDIKLQVTRATFERHFEHTWLEQCGDAYVVRAQDPQTLEWLANRLNRLVKDALQCYVGIGASVEFS